MCCILSERSFNDLQEKFLVVLYDNLLSRVKIRVKLTDVIVRLLAIVVHMCVKDMSWWSVTTNAVAVVQRDLTAF